MGPEITDDFKSWLYRHKIEIIKKEVRLGDKFAIFYKNKLLGSAEDYKNAKILKRFFLKQEWKKWFLKTHSF